MKGRKRRAAVESADIDRVFQTPAYRAKQEKLLSDVMSDPDAIKPFSAFAPFQETLESVASEAAVGYRQFLHLLYSRLSKTQMNELQQCMLAIAHEEVDRLRVDTAKGTPRKKLGSKREPLRSMFQDRWAKNLTVHRMISQHRKLSLGYERLGWALLNDEKTLLRRVELLGIVWEVTDPSNFSLDLDADDQLSRDLNSIGRRELERIEHENALGPPVRAPEMTMFNKRLLRRAKESIDQRGLDNEPALGDVNRYSKARVEEVLAETLAGLVGTVVSETARKKSGRSVRSDYIHTGFEDIVVELRRRAGCDEMRFWEWLEWSYGGGLERALGEGRIQIPSRSSPPEA